MYVGYDYGYFVLICSVILFSRFNKSLWILNNVKIEPSHLVGSADIIKCIHDLAI